MSYDDSAKMEVIATSTCDRFLDILENLKLDDGTEFFVPVGKLLDVLTDILFEHTINMSTAKLTRIQMRIMEMVHEKDEYSRIKEIIVEEAESFSNEMDEMDDIDFEEFLDGFLKNELDDEISREDIEKFLDGEFDELDDEDF